MKPQNAKLWCGKLSDGLYHFIGAIYEPELHELNVKGFTDYNEARQIMKQYNYELFKTQ